MCSVTSLRPECVRYVPETRSLVGVAPGPAQVAFTLGDKLANVAVEVLPAGARRPTSGDVRIEPANTDPGPGASGGRCGSTWARSIAPAAAMLASSDPKVVMIQGNLACAVGARQGGNHRHVPRQQGQRQGPM